MSDGKLGGMRMMMHHEMSHERCFPAKCQGLCVAAEADGWMAKDNLSNCRSSRACGEDKVVSKYIK